MFDRFTALGRRVVVLAQENAMRLNHKTIGTEHILLGLIEESYGIAGSLFRRRGITLEDARQVVSELRNADGEVTTAHVPFTREAKQALEMALREALQMGDQRIYTEHILLGLLRLPHDSLAVQAMRQLGVITSLDVVRFFVVSERQGGQPDPRTLPPHLQASQQAEAETTEGPAHSGSN